VASLRRDRRVRIAIDTWRSLLARRTGAGIDQTSLIRGTVGTGRAGLVEKSGVTTVTERIALSVRHTTTTGDIVGESHLTRAAHEMEIARNGTKAVQVAATIRVGGGIRTRRVKGCGRGRRRRRDTPAAAGRGVGRLGTSCRAGGCVGGDVGWDGAGDDGTVELIGIEGRDLEAGAVRPTGREGGLLADGRARDGTGTVVCVAPSLG
jgi:hypothetical protein